MATHNLLWLRIPMVGALAGLPFILTISPLITAIALAAAMRWIPAASAARSALNGFAFGVSASLVVTIWVPVALRTLGAGWPGAILIWCLLGVWAAGLGYIAIGSLLFVARLWSRTPAGIAIASCVFLWESFCLSEDFGLPALLWAHPFVEFIGVAQLASVFGVPGISALVVFSGYRAARANGSSDLDRTDLALAVSWIAVATLGLSAAETVRAAQSASPSEKRTLLFVQPDFDPHDRWAPDLQSQNLAQIAAFTAEVLSIPSSQVSGSTLHSPADVIFWPETLLTSNIETDSDLRASLEAIVHSLGVPVVTGLVASASSKNAGAYRNAVVWVDPDRGISGWAYKSVAVPVVESERRRPGEAAIADWLGEAARGPHVEEVEQRGPLQGDFEVAVLLCYEALFPRLAAIRRASSTLALVNLADDSWTAGEIATRQLTRFAAYRAIEQRLIFVRLAHGGLSAAFDEFGREIGRAKLDQFDFIWIDARVLPPASWLERSVLLAVFGLPALVVQAGAWIGRPT